MMSIQDLFGIEVVDGLKSYYVSDGVIRTKALMPKSVFKRFPTFERIFNENFTEDYFREVLYCIFNDISSIPECKNPSCNNKTKLRNFVVGFQDCCCRDCTGKLQHVSEAHREKCKAGALARYADIQKKDAYTADMNCDYSQVNFYIFRDYCKHGDAKVYKSVANKIHEYGGGTFCRECNKELFAGYNPSDNDILEFQRCFPEFCTKYAHAMKYDWWMTYYPKYFKIIVAYFERYVEPFDKDSTTYSEMYYQFLHDLKGRPHCCMCDKPVEFQPYVNKYSVFCEDHLYSHDDGYYRQMLGKFIDTLGVTVEKNVQDVIQGELDFYFPDSKLAVEYNGCWWHSDRFKSNDYRRNKWQQCREKGIRLVFVWEDDLLYHEDKVHSLIKSKLGLYEHRAYARQCDVREVSYLEAKAFIDKYHMQGYAIDKVRLGLYSGGELVSIMTFGKSRFKSDDKEIIRYCCKAGWQVVGGAERLLAHFRRECRCESIVSYAECDISDGGLYEALGMEYVGWSENWKWMYKGVRYNRLNKIRNEHPAELVKCYGAGVMKYELKT